MRKWSKILLGGLVLFFVVLMYSAYPFFMRSYSQKLSSSLERQKLPTHLNVISWNMAFAYGLGSEGQHYYKQEKDYFLKNLKSIAEILKREEADIVFLQEVDFASARSHDLDQLKLLSEFSGLKYFAPIVSWENKFVPYPYWPIGVQFGRMKSGGGVLSRYPLAFSDNYLMDKPLSNPWWYNLFYLHRYFQLVDIQIGEKPFQIMNVHLEAYDKNNRMEQAKLIGQFIKDHPHVRIVAGDFNTTPYEALKKSGFTNPKNDYENDKTTNIILETGLKEIIPRETYILNEERYFTFPAHQPDRRLDFMYYHSSLQLMNGFVIREGVADLSDHLPIKAQFKLSDPVFIRD